MNGMSAVGLAPWFPWPLSRWRWWTQPVPAQRLAALRIGIAAVLLLDVLLTYLPGRIDFYGQDSLGSQERRSLSGAAGWSLVDDDSPGLVLLALVGWALAAAGLLVGFCSRLCAVACWALAVSFSDLNPWIENAGDTVRTLCLFYLALSPCGVVWSVDSWLRAKPKPVLVHPWPLRLLFLQMTLIYFCNGLHKLVGYDWPMGKSLYWVLGDLTLARWSMAWFALPYALTRVLTWLVLGWEVLFPLLVLWRRTRVATLWLGVMFHLGTLISMEIGSFALSMLCLYLPLVPWEKPGQAFQPDRGTASPQSGWKA
jgi:hypothetical protein